MIVINKHNLIERIIDRLLKDESLSIILTGIKGHGGMPALFEMSNGTITLHFADGSVDGFCSPSIREKLEQRWPDTIYYIDSNTSRWPELKKKYEKPTLMARILKYIF